MFIHFFYQEFFKKQTKLGLIGIVLGGISGLLFAWFILNLEVKFPIIKKALASNNEVI